jgi:transposase
MNCMHIQFARQTIKALERRCQQACREDDARLVRHISVLLDVVVDQTPVAVVSARWGVSPATVYEWLQAFLMLGLNSLRRSHGGGRKAKLTPTQKKRLCQLIDAGPKAAGFDTACWSALLLRQLMDREFGVLYNRFYVCELLRNLGYSFQKARFVSDHLEEAKRREWVTQEWPKLLKKAKRGRALLLFGDEASFPQWGTLSYTWARRGEQPTVKTCGKRKAYKVFGLIEFFSGRLFYQGIEGKFTSASYQAFLEHVLAQTTEHLYLVQDGAKYHTSKAMKNWFTEHSDRLTVCQLPSYSPDYNPIEYLWRKTKKRTTHNEYFETFDKLIVSVEKALKFFSEQPAQVLGLFGFYCDEVGLERKTTA